MSEDQRTEGEAKPVEGGGRLGRRGLLLGGMAAAAGGLLAKVKPAKAADNEPLIVGRVNTASQQTTLAKTDGPDRSAFAAFNDGNDPTQAILGVSRRVGLVGYTPAAPTISSSFEGFGVPGRIGVLGSAPSPAAVPVISPTFGVAGISRIGVLGGHDLDTTPPLTVTAGVFGASRGIGVAGAWPPEAVPVISGTIGVGGFGGELSGIGVLAGNTAGGVGLQVLGKARFSTAGGGMIPARQRMHQVADPSVGPSSLIIVTLTSDPGRARIAWVERRPDTGFVIHLDERSRGAVSFSYLVVEPGMP